MGRWRLHKSFGKKLHSRLLAQNHFSPYISALVYEIFYVDGMAIS